MEMVINLPGDARVDAHFGSFTVQTDQPPSATAPTPFALFLASIGTCAGIYVAGFCNQRGLPTKDIRIVEHIETDHATGMVTRVGLTIQLPPDFPEKYRDAVIRAADQCAVKKHIEKPPTFDVQAVIG